MDQHVAAPGKVGEHSVLLVFLADDGVGGLLSTMNSIQSSLNGTSNKAS